MSRASDAPGWASNGLWGHSGDSARKRLFIAPRRSLGGSQDKPGESAIFLGGACSFPRAPLTALPWFPVAFRLGVERSGDAKRSPPGAEAERLTKRSERAQRASERSAVVLGEAPPVVVGRGTPLAHGEACHAPAAGRREGMPLGSVRLASLRA